SLKRARSSRARSVLNSSWPRQRNFNGPAQNFSPSCPVEPRRMFSSTLSLESTLVSWKVRTMPIRATLNHPTPLSDVPLNDQSPWSGWSKPVSRLKNVVLPAPFGPISAVITPRWISTWSTSTAVRPPNVRRTPSATTIGSGLETPGSASSPARALRASSAEILVAAVGVSAGIERDLLPVAEDPLRSEDHQQHERQADEHEADVGGLVGVHEARDPRLGREVGQDAADEGESSPEDHRAHDRGQDAARAAQDQHRERDECEV